ncbi:hypothetical protein FE257_000280 [Aspergillus nanangensis]|uniref:Mitochondrial inner-membrane-bound regulator-domain-containing protein n=1 Tax=Aspergillus nanangensis TaxID=2582783 RepID=A0AAD4H037_ASPNN|nr:hypothetical protein FE257_000280 [Aspergillus nanangensis]
MLSRSSQTVAGLLTTQVRRSCAKCTRQPTLRQCDVLARFQHTENNPEPSESRPSRYKRKPKRRPGFKKENHKRVPIGVTALGEPGEVVVVSNPRRRRNLPVNSPEISNEDVDKNALPFMLNELEDNEDILDSSAVNERIESFCAPSLPRSKLALNDWDDLRTRLQLSFTTQQLLDYLSEFADNGLTKAEARISQGKSDPAEWRPGTSSFLETGPVSPGGVADRIASSQHLTGKQLLSEKILRDCWHLGVIDEVGQLDIRLPSHSLTLLLSSKHFSFEELASLHEASIDVTTSLGLVRVTGRQYACESIRDIVYDALTRIREEEFVLYSADDVRFKKSNPIFNAEFLSWVSQTYGVAFEQDVGRPKKIFYLAENKQDADNARRTLNLASYEASSPPIPFSTYLPASESVNVHDVVSEESLSWFDRQKAWFRWAMPSSQTAETMPEGTPLFDNHQTRLSDELLKLLRQASPTYANEGSTAEVHESVTAAVGRSLFLRKPSFQDAGVSASQLGRMSLPRAFATDIPQVTPFLRMLTPHLPEEPQRPHRIRLVPSAIHSRVFPQLEVEVAVQGASRDFIDSGSEIVMRNAKAIISESNVDYLLPESGLDLRFSRKLTRDLSDKFMEIANLETLHSTLKDLFSKCLSNEHEVPLPAFTQISLPNSLLGHTDGAQDVSTGYTTGDYMFLPVNDIRGTRIHRYDYKGQQLNYAFYESGPFTALRTTDLFLDLDLTDKSLSSAAEPNSSEEPVQREFNSFYTTACSLSFELDKVRRTL